MTTLSASSTSTDSQDFPLWFTVITGLFVFSNLVVFGGVSLFSPLTTFPEAGAAAAFPIQFFAIRHIAMAFPLAYGLIRKDVKTLTVMYSIFIIMSVLDIAVLGVFGYDIPILGLIPAVSTLPAVGKVILGSVAFLTPVTASLWYLTTQAK